MTQVFQYFKFSPFLPPGTIWLDYNLQKPDKRT